VFAGLKMVLEEPRDYQLLHSKMTLLKKAVVVATRSGFEGMVMIYIVDGTGNYSDSDYAASMAASHCNKIYYLNKTSANYWRGPDMFDLVKRTTGIATTVFDAVMRNEFPPALLAPGMRQSPKTPIRLVGYSRGGAAVVMVANMLAERDVAVDAMFLFDAVSRTTSFTDVDTVPGNVQRCNHAIRNEGAEVVMEYEEGQLWKKCEQTPGYDELAREYRRVGSGSFGDFLLMRSVRVATQYPELRRAAAAWKSKSDTLKQLKAAMRNSFSVESADVGPSIPFGNCARKFDPKCKYEAQGFAGTHGALGGVPWTTLGPEIGKLDHEASLRVWSWMSSRMLRFGIKAGRA
jgi:hypothetical protein